MLSKVTQHWTSSLFPLLLLDGFFQLQGASLAAICLISRLDVFSVASTVESILITEVNVLPIEDLSSTFFFSHYKIGSYTIHVGIAQKAFFPTLSASTLSKPSNAKEGIKTLTFTGIIHRIDRRKVSDCHGSRAS